MIIMKKVYGTDDTEKFVPFLLENSMEKSEKNKLKDYKRTKGKVWVRTPVTFDKRTTGSGVTFQGRYVLKTGDAK